MINVNKNLRRTIVANVGVVAAAPEQGILILILIGSCPFSTRPLKELSN
jgi:hypothetical protein